MKTQYAVGIATLAAFAAGAVAVHGLHAQTKAPVYLIEEVHVTDTDGFVKEAVPKFLAVNKAGGVRALAAGGKVTAIEGDPPKPRVIIQVWDSAEKMHEFRNSADYKEARKVADQYAKFRVFAVEGIAQ
jgi:uncharacterized protein (DUF1330 family)